MSDLVVRALEYGVLGLCAICLVTTLAVLRKEQGRQGAPRKGVIQLAFGFMVFSLALAALGAFVQLTEQREQKASEQRTAKLEEQVRSLNKTIETLNATQVTGNRLLVLQGRLREIDYQLRSKFRYEVESSSRNPETLRWMVNDLRNSVRSAMQIAGAEVPPE